MMGWILSVGIEVGYPLVVLAAENLDLWMISLPCSEVM